VTEEALDTGAALRVRGPSGGTVVLCVNGGTARDVPGSWSGSLEYLVGRLAPRFPDLAWAEIRYRIRSWKRLGMCIEDGHAALEHVARSGADEVVLLGYSMGGAVASTIAGHPLVRRVIGLAPWLPERLDASGMAGRRIDVLHGSLDRYLPGIPGVSPDSSRAGFERLLSLGATGSYTTIAGATHGVALRAPWGGLIPLPRAGAWVAGVAGALRAGAPA
jgi:pimeloyl-ACP methyl ester carboxylesterase